MNDYDRKIHPDPLVAAECEIERLQGMLCEARGGLLRAAQLRVSTPQGLAIKNDIRSALVRTGGMEAP